MPSPCCRLGLFGLEKKSLIGNGVVIEPWALFDEIDKVRNQGVEISAQNLSIADNAPSSCPCMFC